MITGDFLVKLCKIIDRMELVVKELGRSARMQHYGVGLRLQETFFFFLSSCLTLDVIISRSSLDFAEEDCEIGPHPPSPRPVLFVFILSPSENKKTMTSIA